MAVANYQDANGTYPPAFINGPDGKPWHSWRILLLPYLEQSQLYKEYSFAEPWNGPNNSKLAARMPRTYGSSALKTPGSITNYLAVVGKGTVWPGSATVSSKDVLDDPGATILVVENLGAGIHWMEPRDLNLDTMDFQINRPNGISSPYANPAFVALNSLLFYLEETITPATLRALLTISGGEAVEHHEVNGWEIMLDGRKRELKNP